MTEPAGGAEPSGHDGPHVFVDDLERPELAGDDEHHVVRVLRLKTGGTLTISNGHGAWRLARLAPGHEIEAAGPITDVERPQPELTIGFALVKGDRPELVVQKATELGIDVVVPFVADRSVVRWDANRAVRHVERLQRVAREAAMQSRRCWLPMVRSLTPLQDLAAEPGAAGADRQGPPLTAETTTMLIGPEGGWSETERSSLPRRVGLGPHVLRAETAAITASAMLAAMRDGLIAPPASSRQQ